MDWGRAPSEQGLGALRGMGRATNEGEGEMERYKGRGKVGRKVADVRDGIM